MSTRPRLSDRPDPARRFIGAAAAALTLTVVPGTALQAQEVRLEAPDASLADDFGAIQTVRELPDGRVLVADPLGKALYVVDFQAGTRRRIGREGQGPDEYMQPDAVWALPGDSTLLVDLGNARLTVLDPSLAFRRTAPISQAEFRPGAPLILALPQGVDGRGRLYFRSLSAGEPADSGDVLRMVPGGSAEPVARFKLEDRQVTRTGGANSQQVSVRPVPLSPQDAWGVARDGSVAIARAGEYRVDWVAPDGTLTRGRPVPVRPVRIGRAEKEAWLAERARSGGSVSISLEVENGRASMGFARGNPGGSEADLDQYTWPENAPAFVAGRLPVDGLDRAWVRRTMPAGQPATYDVFGRDGIRVGIVILPAERRVVGFGNGTMYVVAYDEYDLNYLERYLLPVL